MARRPLEFLFSLPIFFMFVVLLMEYLRLRADSWAEKAAAKTRQQIKAAKAKAKNVHISELDDDDEDEVRLLYSFELPPPKTL